MSTAIALEIAMAVLSWAMWKWRKQPMYLAMSAIAAAWAIIFFVLAVVG